MDASTVTPPAFLPRLSAGRHRNPKRGACMMEYASFLAGERWSDHPACTHRVLATIARGVNDLVTSRTRDTLVEFVPRVIGVTSDDPRMAARLALTAAADALPVASMERQHALAVGVRHTLAELERLGDADEEMTERATIALNLVPEAAEWSRKFCASLNPVPSRGPRPNYEAIATIAVLGIAEACIEDPDTRLRALLEDTLEEGEVFVRREAKRGQGLAA
jgi:hypothetical protein